MKSNHYSAYRKQAETIVNKYRCILFGTWLHLAILGFLVNQPECAVWQAMEAIGCGRNEIGRALMCLRKYGFVQSDKRGRCVHYSIVDDQIHNVNKVLSLANKSRKDSHKNYALKILGKYELFFRHNWRTLATLAYLVDNPDSAVYQIKLGIGDSTCSGRVSPVLKDLLKGGFVSSRRVGKFILVTIKPTQLFLVKRVLGLSE